LHKKKKIERGERDRVRERGKERERVRELLRF
jgi:hypothetical protein